MRILLSAFAFGPGQGTEPGFGWGWAQAVAEAGNEVIVLTRPENREIVEPWVAEHPVPGLQVEYVGIPRLTRPLWRHARNVAPSHWIVYLAWMQAALRRARELHDSRPFDVSHHVTYSTLIPGCALARLDVPLVFGPLGSGQRAPLLARPLFGRSWPRERLRSLVIAGTHSRLNPLACRTVRRAGVVLATNTDTAELATALGAARVELMCDTGMSPALIGATSPSPRSGRPRVAWVGKLIPRKGLRLALDAFDLAAREVDAELHIAGEGRQGGELQRWIEERDLSSRVHHHGFMPWEDVQRLYLQSDIMLFTSVRESFGSQLVEAAAAGLPIVAVDLHGVASLVPDDAAAKVPLGPVAETAAGLARAIVDVLTDDARRARMSEAALRFAERESWPERARRAGELYRQITAGGVGERV